jgi:DNA-binding NarL/FixJ family response regulator
MGPQGGFDQGRPAPTGVMGTIRVALVDDHHLIRDGLRLVLQGEPGFDIVGEAGDHASAIDLVVAEKPHVLLLI